MLIVSDLDGTLLGRSEPISQANRAGFLKAQRAGAICAIATGRSLRGAEQSLDADFPIDYLIFSSGAGIWDWKTKTLLHQNDLGQEQVHTLSMYLSSLGVDYTIQLEAPHSHQFVHTPFHNQTSDFYFRVNQHSLFGKPIDPKNLPKQASEFIVIDSSKSAISTYEKIVSDLSSDFNVVRATSPLDGQSIWIEIFPQSTSKAHAADLLRARHKIELKDTFALGNDYNDLQLLSWAGNSLVVGDAPQDLLEKYAAVNKHTESAFAHAIEIWL